MKLTFSIHYHTFPGQQPKVTGSISELGMFENDKAPLMQLVDLQSGLWKLELEIPENIEFSYRYVIKDDNFSAYIDEWGADRIFIPSANKTDTFLISDKWRATSNPEYALFSSAFLNAILKPTSQKEGKKAKKAKDSIIVRFKPTVSRVESGDVIALSGNCKSLGNWDEKKAVELGNNNFPVWCSEVNIPLADFPVSYKFLIKNNKGNNVFWENSDNHLLELPKGKLPDYLEINDEFFSFPRASWKGAGVAIPVFSLRRKDGFGVGEFTDIKLLVDWASNVGIKLIQILPINDTVAKHTWQDSYPYAAISVYALHTIYLNIAEMGKLNSEINQQIIEAQGKYLNSLNKIDYEAVMKLKARFIKLLYDQNKHEFLADKDFKKFFAENEHWLKPYAVFSYLRDLFNTPDFSRWGIYSNPTDELMALLTNEKAAHFDEIAVHYFIQYHGYKQLLEAADYARSKGIVLKGDIPIGIYRNSVDAWYNPELFHMDRQAGAPPDDFSASGQNWRFPTYNWKQMSKDNYRWWQQRLKQLSGYFDAFRIDHILGFFRIWEIPASQVEGLLGYFNPSIPYYADELQSKGMWFDEQRLCKPYIREHFLYERFGDLTQFAKENFLNEYSPGCYELKPEYDSQKKVEEKLQINPDSGPAERSRTERLVNGLYSLISEVIFVKAPDADGSAWFPRNSMHFTRSYQELDGHTKHILNEIYIDYFYRRNEAYWRENAMVKLPVIKKATNMLLCGEDLGMVPACVPDVMNDLGILSLELQRMPKNPKVKFAHPNDNSYLSVATPSSHDTSTIRGWWKENPGLSQQFYNEMLGNWGASPYECTPEIVEQIIVQHLYSTSMWAIFPIQDLLGMDGELRLPDADAERINVPANPNHYWRYRLHLNLEDLINETGFNEKLRSLIENSGRGKAY